MDDKYSYSYERTSDYCYHDSDVLINKLNIKNDKELFVAEREFVTYRAAILLDESIKGNFNFEHLKAIHEFLFQDVYSWAGQPRTCNIAKTNLFCLAQYIDIYAADVFSKIIKNDYYISMEYDEKVKTLADLFSDINALHPFREGNGRTQREFINGLAKINGLKFDFTKVTEKEMIIASSESTAGDTNKLLAMFKRIAKPISKEEQLKVVDDYIEDKKLATMLKENV